MRTDACSILKLYAYAVCTHNCTITWLQISLCDYVHLVVCSACMCCTILRCPNIEGQKGKNSCSQTQRNFDLGSVKRSQRTSPCQKSGSGQTWVHKTQPFCHQVLHSQHASGMTRLTCGSLDRCQMHISHYGWAQNGHLKAQEQTLKPSDTQKSLKRNIQ